MRTDCYIEPSTLLAGTKSSLLLRPRCNGWYKTCWSAMNAIMKAARNVSTGGKNVRSVLNIFRISYSNVASVIYGSVYVAG